MLKIYDGRESFYQWDGNRKLIISNPEVDEVHFCNRTGDCSLVCAVYDFEGFRVADVPNILLQTAWPIKAYAFCEGCYTQDSAVFKVIARTQPTDYVYEETQVVSINQVVEDALTVAKESGDFRGEQGPAPVKGVDYWTEEEQKKLAEDAVDVVLEGLDTSTRTLNIYDFYAGTPAQNGTGFNYMDNRFAATVEFLECTKEYPYSITPNPGCQSTASIYYYSNGKYLGVQGGFKTYIPDVTKGYKGTETVTHIRVAIRYKNQISGGAENITPDNIEAAVNEFTFTRSYINPYARQSELPNKFDASGYNIPVLRLAGSIGCMTKETDVPLTYVYGDRTGSCTLKWQGNSSLQYEKKNYTIKFDTAFEAAPGWGEQKKYCLKANFVDFTQARNVCAAKLWGQVVATRANVPEQLAAAPNYGAVDGFPIALYINDNYYGVYTFNIPKDKWTFNMGSGANEAVVCAEGPTDTSKVRFRKPGVIVDKDYAVEYAPDEDNVQWIVDSLDTMITQLNAVDIDTMTAADMNALDAYIDWNSVIDYIIFICLTNGYDGITKNHILLTYNGQKWYFSAYDMDCTFGIHGSAGKVVSMNDDLAKKTMINQLCTLNRAFYLARRHKKAELIARYNELRAGVLSDDNVITTFTNFICDIPKALQDEECLIWKTLPATSTSNMHQIADFYTRKSALLDAEIAAMTSTTAEEV